MLNLSLLNWILSALCFLNATPFDLNKKTDAHVIVSTFGKQPTVAIDKSNNIKIVFGEGEKIFFTQSTDGGQSFSSPQLVGSQAKLALGATRGPQIAITKDYTLIAAAAHTGKIMVYRTKNGENKWSEPVNILHRDTTATEGFIALASGRENNVYAVWLDHRIGRKNNIFSASSADGGKTWSKNRLVYASPGGRVCPCCRPSITADAKGNVYVMFRNELEGARDMYIAHSRDGGKTFNEAKKLGVGTWLLNACPMDGGALAKDVNGNVGSVWRREGAVYYAEPGGREQKIAEGRAATLTKTINGDYILWQQGENIMAKTPDKYLFENLGKGIYPRAATLPDQTVFSIWESEGKIVARILP